MASPLPGGPSERRAGDAARHPAATAASLVANPGHEAPTRLVERIERNEARYRHLVELSPDGIFVSRDGRISFANPAFLRLVGAGDAGEVLGHRLLDFVPAGEQAVAGEMLRRLVEEGRPEPLFEARVQRLDGATLDVEIAAMPFDEEGVRCVEVVMRDATARRRHEDELRRAREQLEQRVTERTAELLANERSVRAIVDTALDGVISTDGRGVVTGWNARATDIFGWSSADAIGRAVVDLVVPAHLAGLARQTLASLVEADRAGFSARFETPVVARSGREFAAEVSVVRLDSPTGPAFSAFVRDIEDRRRAELAVRGGERRLRQIIDLVPHYIFAKDLEGRFLLVNQAVAAAYGTTVEQLLGRRDADFAKSEAEVAHFRADDLEVMRGGAPKLIPEETITDAQGNERILQTVKIPFTFSGTGSPAVLGVSTDITDRKRAEERFLQAQKMEGLGRLAGGIAHDFNNLLTAILGYAQLLGADAGTAARRDVDAIRGAAERAAALTRQLLTFARRQRTEARVIDLNELTLELDKLLRRVLGADIELVTVVGDGPAPVEADPGQLEQVLVNLAVNARDAMPGGGRIVLSIHDLPEDELPPEARGQVRAGPTVEISVEDTGVGMTKEVLDRAFEPFFTTKGPGVGTGLGLATSYGIVKQFGGHIWGESEPHRGSTFHIVFPRSPKGTTRVRESDERPVPRGGETVLVVDDDGIVLDVSVRALESSGYRVLAAPTATAALAIAQAHTGTIDLLLADIVMPGLSGPEVAERILLTRPRTRVLFVSGYHEIPLPTSGPPAGHGEILAKPFTPASLARRVRETLDRDA